MKKNIIISIIFSIIFFLSCGPSACDCAKLLKANYERGLFWEYGMSNSDKEKTRECMDKYNVAINAENKCNN